MAKDHLESFAFTSIGCVRQSNQDAALVMKKQRVFVVADGMGGGSAGEVASAEVVNAIEACVNKAEQRPAEMEAAVIQALYSANQQIVEYASEHGYKNMATTVACLVFNPWHPSLALVIHAGDSRVYRYRKISLMQRIHNKELLQLTKDHSVNSNSNIITNGVGFGQPFYLESSYVDVQANDLFIICSDGLSHMVSDKDIARICMISLQNNSNVEAICTTLVDRALEKGGRDNVTVIAIRVGSLPEDYVPTEEEAEKECELQLKNIHDLEGQSRLD